ncbi:XK-related protein 8-like [Xiphophorus hellerii]|uniref:XK-related protein 8-like n=1 Tax=Xiphophorus hellerii TaxID=8084 RepID=UPI0013B3E062|nr:XK-related protein 8-like [Xiphophorus hellerii]
MAETRPSLSIEELSDDRPPSHSEESQDEDEESSSPIGCSFIKSCMGKPKSIWSFFLYVLGLALFVLDVVLDFKTLVMFGMNREYGHLAVLLVLLIGSAVLTHTFSWLWYKDDEFAMMTNLERILYPNLGFLHIFHLGIYTRHAAIATASMENLRFQSEELKKIIKYRKHDQRILGIFEAYSESAPQVVLLLSIVLSDDGWTPAVLTVRKILVSFVSIIFSEAKYYKSVISCLSETDQFWCCSCTTVVRLALFFLWKLLLVLSRLVALALFASVEPCYIFTHFVCSWLLLFFVASYIETKQEDSVFRKSVGEKWLFRGTVALIWYFSWFSGVVRRRTSKLMLFYHLYMLVDIWVLCGLWYCGIGSNPLHLEISSLHIAVFAGSVPAFYVIGLFWKGIYFYGLHPDVEEKKLEEDKKKEKMSFFTHVQPTKWMCVKKQKQLISSMKIIFYLFYLLPGFSKCFKNLGPDSNEPPRSNRRMEELAKSFYIKQSDGSEDSQQVSTAGD